MNGWFVWGAMDLARTIEYAVQAGWSLIVSFIWLLPLIGVGATESGIHCCAIGVVAIASRLCLLRRSLPLLFLTSEVPALLAVLLLRASQLSSPAQKRVMSAVRSAIDFGFSWPRWRASHSSWILCLKASRASASGQSTIWFFLVRNLFQNFRADSPGY